jgi:hypothetical protein
MKLIKDRKMPPITANMSQDRFFNIRSPNSPITKIHIVMPLKIFDAECVFMKSFRGMIRDKARSYKKRMSDATILPALHTSHMFLMTEAFKWKSIGEHHLTSILLHGRR